MGNGEFPVSIVLKALDRISSPLAKMGKPFQSLKANVESLNNSFQAHTLKMESFTKGFKGAGEALEGAGLRMTLGITAPIAAFRHEAIAAAAEFEESMNRVEAATGASGAELTALKELARQVGRTTTFSADEAGGAMAALAREGMSTHDIMEKLPEVTNLAAAAHLGLAQAAGVVTEVLNGYNVPAEKSARAIDVIAKASQITRGGLEGFGDAMAKVGPLAASMNIPIEESTAVIAAMSRVGLVGGKAGGMLAKGIESILNPGEAAVRTLTRLKINPWDVMDKNRNLKSIIGLMELLKSRGASTADIMQIFGLKGGLAFQALLAKGTPALRELEAQLKTSGGAAEKLGEIQEKGLNADLKRLSNSFKNLGVAIGESGALGSLAHFVEMGVTAMNWMAQANPTLLKLGFIFLGIVAAIGPVLGYLGMIATGIGALLPLLSMLGTAFAAVWMFALGPVGLFIGAVGVVIGLAALIWKYWGPIKDLFGGIWDKAKALVGLAPSVSASTSSAAALPSNVIPFSSAGSPYAPATAMSRPGLPGGRNETHLLVEFENMPRGAKVQTKRSDAPLDLTRGYAMETGS